jgi:hypothetical protein
MVTYIVAIGLALHGLVHALGFAAAWRLGAVSAVSTTPSLVSIAEGSPLTRILGLLWLCAALIFVVAAGGLVATTTWWRIVAASAAVLSLVLCVAWWNDAKAGAALDVAILIGLVATFVFSRTETAS